MSVILQEDTLSINHNWLNAGNIDICWRFLNDSLAAVELVIQEHRQTMDNWTEHCQVLSRLIYSNRYETLPGNRCLDCNRGIAI